MSQFNGPASSVTPTQANLFRHGRSQSNHSVGDGSHFGARDAQDSGRSLANALAFGPRGASLAPSAQAPGSFSSDLKTVTQSRVGTPRGDLGTFTTGDYFGAEGAKSSEQRQKELRDKINKETKIKIGSENLLEALISKNAKQTKDQRYRVETELTSSNRKLQELTSQLEDEIEQSKRPTTPSRDRLSGLFQGSPMKSPNRETRFSQDQFSLVEQESESPTYILAEILQALEVEGMQPDYYVERANHLVELFKRYPTLKYDLAWPIFGLRVQTMLLSESREVIAAGYRVTRHAIADMASLKVIRDLNTDDLIILSLVKESKASIEREQALKFVRAFLDVKDGVKEISSAIVRTIVAVAEHHEDRLRNMSLMTISEILIRDPAVVVAAGGISALSEALADGSYHGPESLAMNFLHLADKPQQRGHLQSGYELDSAFTPFTDPLAVHGHEEKLRSSARLLAAALSNLIGNADDSTLRRKGTLLLGEVLKLADHCLPNTLSGPLQVLPTLVEDSSLGETEDGSMAAGVVYQIDSVNRTLQRSGLASKPQPFLTAVARQPDLNTLRSRETAKPKLSADMDELQFRTLMLETQVLTTANYLKWKWDLINDLIEGPLLNSKRLDESIKGGKFMKRLDGFYRPFKYRFSDARNTKPNQRYVRTGCALMKTLLQTPEGIAYLAESKLLRQLAECLAQLDRHSGLTATSPLFSPYNVSEKLTGGYFALLGALSSDPKGLQMIQRWHMINMFYHIMELEGRDDLIKALLSNMDFSLDSHLRVMLSKALTACPKGIRIYSTKLLRKYATASPQDSGGHASEWAIRLLVTQLYDPEVQVSEIAVQILEEEMDDWFLGRNDSYVTLVEASLSQALLAVPERPRSSNNDEQIKSQEYGTVPPHFYRELTRTIEGCQLLKDSGHFDSFVANIQDSWSENEDREKILKLKGSLWAVGNVGSMELGAPFLEETDVVDWIVKIATSSEVMTIRGTAFFVLGLISRSLHGMEILTEHGWNAATDHLGRSLGYCLPPDLKDLLSMHPTAVSRPPDRLPPPVRSRSESAVEDDDPLLARILKLISDLGNTVLTKRAAGDLFSIKTKSPDQFSSVALFRKVMVILEKHNFRLPVRRFVIDLFDKSVMRRIVLDDESGDESSIDEQRR
ncbi:rapamycin-insensitive companion of mTOR, partial [Lecanoromycetidae sp. Uapishka_2]